MEKSCINCSYYPDKSPCESCEGYSNFDDSWCNSPCATTNIIMETTCLDHDEEDE